MPRKKTGFSVSTVVIVALGLSLGSLLLLANFERSKPADQKSARIYSSPEAFGCTIVMAARNGLVLAGNNEDRNHPQTIVSFMPATESFYG
ncbi:MAG: hypothetical protein OEW18_12360, partial [Candidatus Aminicenantes bacterium]|nr:hypothetical protein [Candidatus Aminicenantes bacterium]